MRTETRIKFGILLNNGGSGMAISIQPVDGLINRLLQQNSKPSSVARQQQPAPGAKQDHVSISTSAQKQVSVSAESYIQAQSHGQSQGQSSNQSQSKLGERALESHLLNLYKKHDSFGG